MIRLTNHPINEQEVIESVRSSRAGAVVLFLGTTREITGEARTVSLDYEAYRPMAENVLDDLESEAQRRWPILHCIIIHRIGNVPPAATSIAIAVSSPHRQDAFTAGQWLIDQIKEQAPIWKREQFADGTKEWVHPYDDDTT